MAQVGSNVGAVQQSLTGITDAAGNSVVSADNTFGGSPLGIAARAQALYGIPNANFNLTPPDPSSPIVENENELPYWSITNDSDGEMNATSVFDENALTYGILLDPGTAAVDSVMTLTTRSYLLTDDNLALRQRALAVIEKSGTAAGTTQWNLTLSATYYDPAGSALSTAFIGTALDTGTWTSFSGTTTPGGSAINAAAQYVDLQFKMTATAAVTGSAKATIKSLLLTTSTPGGGGGSQSFVVKEAFTASTTWTPPASVTALLFAGAIGAGGGGGSGSLAVSGQPRRGAGAGGGGGAGFQFVTNLEINAGSAISVGIGAGGAGGTAANASGTIVVGVNGAAGGATTFGSFLTVNGGGGGTGGGLTSSGGGGTAGLTPSSTVYGVVSFSGGAGGAGTLPSGTTAGTAGSGLNGSGTAYTAYPYWPALVAGNVGGTPINETTPVGAPGSAGTAGIGGGGGGSGGAFFTTTGNTSNVHLSGRGGAGAGGGGEGAILDESTGTAGDGGNAGSVAGAGGGGGGGAIILGSPAAPLTIRAGQGGKGADGYVVVVYVA
jgi:hypothetical protein